MLSLYTVCFFGHRRIDDIITVENAVENVINKVLRQHEYVEFLVGRDGEFALEAAVAAENALSEQLPDDLKPMLTAFVSAHDLLLDATSRSVFEIGFKYGIKAAIAQAYLIVTRPFPEGNERLGRIISGMILLRSGYSFFSDVSLSALIARRSYAYYEAAANILREENEGDMTYFVEYYLELLSRAVDERRLRIQNAENEVRQAEIEMARTALSPPSHTGPPGNMTAAREKEVIAEENEFPDGFHTVSANEPEQSFDGGNGFEISLARIKDRLYEMIGGKGEISKKCSKVLLKLFDEGVYSFNSEDFVQRCGVSRNSASVFIGHLREKGLIEYGDQSPGEYKTYRVKSDLPPLLPGDYAPSIINTIRELQHSETSENDRRLGDLLLSCLPKGLITAADYEQYNVTEKMPSEMSLPLQMGLVTKVTRHVYRINRNVSKETKFELLSFQSIRGYRMRLQQYFRL